jgi:hypothetical protein
MSEDKFADILKSIDTRITEVWTAINGIRESHHKIETKLTERVTKVETSLEYIPKLEEAKKDSLEKQVKYNKGLILVVLVQLIAWAIDKVRNIP